MGENGIKIVKMYFGEGREGGREDCMLFIASSIEIQT